MIGGENKTNLASHQRQMAICSIARQKGTVKVSELASSLESSYKIGIFLSNNDDWISGNSICSIT